MFSPAAPENGSITILRERISTWVLIDILDLFHRLSTASSKLYPALIRHTCKNQVIQILPGPAGPGAIHVASRCSGGRCGVTACRRIVIQSRGATRRSS